MARYSIRRKNHVNIGRVISKIAVTLVALWAGGTIVNTLGDTMRCTSSSFYEGLSLIGWTIADGVNTTSNTLCNQTTTPTIDASTGLVNNVITVTDGTGILGVIGLIAIASIVMEFVEIRMM